MLMRSSAPGSHRALLAIVIVVVAIGGACADDGEVSDATAAPAPAAPALDVDTEMWRDLAKCIDTATSVVPAEGDDATEGVDGVVEVSNVEAAHVDGCVDYPSSPAVGGPHYKVWATCGLYYSPVAEENVVHSMEHGAVWIAYPVSIDESQLEAIANRVVQSGHILASPYPGLEDELVLSAWARQATIDVTDTDTLDAFLEAYVEGPQTPEPGATCSRGIGQPIAVE